MQEIQLPDEGKRIVREFAMEEERYQQWKRLFEQEEEQFLEKISEEEEPEKLALYLYVRLAAECCSEYEKRGISRKIYFATFSDISIWFENCLARTGRPGLQETKWLILHLKLRIFRLGRLQFELAPEKKALHVHIPQGEPLTPESCDDSFAQADRFFGEEYEIYDCDSWLTSPKMKELLSEDSNIIKFQNRFQIESIHYPFRLAEQRVFGQIREDKESYPEDTSLQKKMKAYVCKGNDIGMGYGIIYRKNK